MSSPINIAFISTKYNWDSYSIIRSTFETLDDMGHYVMWYKDFPEEKFYMYDMVWVFSSLLDLTVQQYELCKGVGVKVVSFGLSDPNMYRKDRPCDVYVSSYYDTLNSIYFPTCCDLRYHIKKDNNKSINAVFIGTGVHPFINRQKMFSQLTTPITIVGPNWPNATSCYKGYDMINMINRSHLCVDLTNGETSIGRRIFESSACGTPILTYRRPDVQQMFEEDKEIFMYGSMNELNEKLACLIKEPKQLDRVGESARQRCIKEHDITHRLHTLLEKL